MEHVCIRVFDEYMTAHVILGRLQNEFISCFLADEITHTTGPFLSTPMGGIKLMVAKQHVERALEILNEMENPSSSE